MYQINMLYALNLYNVTHKLYLNYKCKLTTKGGNKMPLLEASPSL